MRLIYSYFWSGLGGGDIIHSESGVSIMYDPYESKHMFAQFISGEKEGPLNKDRFKKCIESKFPEKGGDLIVKQEDSSPYTVRDVELSDDVKSAFKKIEDHCNSNEKPYILTLNDKDWLEELLNYFIDKFSKVDELEDVLKPNK